MNFEKENKENVKENLLDTIIETERLILRPVSLEYKEMIFSNFKEDIVKYMFPSLPSQIGDTEIFINKSTENMEKGSDLVVNIFNKKTNEFLGGGGIHHLDTKTPELGIWIKKSGHGHKFGLEAVRGLKEWAEKNLEYEYLTYPVAKKNIASRMIPESFGAKVGREFMGKKQDGSEMEEVEYRIYK